MVKNEPAINKVFINERLILIASFLLGFQEQSFSSVFVLAKKKQGVPLFRPLSSRKLGNA